MPFQGSDVYPKLTERRFMGQVLTLARLFGWAAWHDEATNAPRRCWQCGAVQKVPRNRSGWPDLVLVRPPKLMFAELKSTRGRVTRDQGAWLSLLRRVTSVEVVVWRPSDDADIERSLR